MRWDPQAYAAYGDERSRPFFELLARVVMEEPATVVDLGCGPGNLTATLARRWPTATVIGVDSSPDMVAAAQQHADPPRLTFVGGDAATWRPDAVVGVVVANALLHWIPNHLDVLATYAGWLTTGGALAFQVPDNFDEPAHTLLDELKSSARWRRKLGGVARAGVERPQRYLQALLALGLDADVWQTTYLHVLPGDDPVLDWVIGTALRPVLSVLDEDERAAFLTDYASALRSAYPRGPHGTVFPFRRTFAVGHRR